MSTVLPSVTPIENAKARYALAKASNRIFARIFDSAIVLVLAISFALIIITTDRAGIKSALSLYQTWRYFLISFIAMIIFVSYFLVLPYFTKGRTIAFLVFKLRIYNLIPTKNFFTNLVKREFFLWMIVTFANLALGIVLCTMSSDEATKFLKQLLLYTETEKTNRASIAIFQIFYVIGAFLLIFVIIHMCIYNKRRCFIDHISDTAVIKLVDISSSDSNPSANAKTAKRKRNYGLPGEIIAGAENEIDSL